MADEFVSGIINTPGGSGSDGKKRPRWDDSAMDTATGATSTKPKGRGRGPKGGRGRSTKSGPQDTWGDPPAGRADQELLAAMAALAVRHDNSLRDHARATQWVLAFSDADTCSTLQRVRVEWLDKCPSKGGGPRPFGGLDEVCFKTLCRLIPSKDDHVPEITNMCATLSAISKSIATLRPLLSRAIRRGPPEEGAAWLWKLLPSNRTATDLEFARTFENAIPHIARIAEVRTDHAPESWETRLIRESGILGRGKGKGGKGKGKGTPIPSGPIPTATASPTANAPKT